MLACRTSFAHTDPDGGDATDKFALDDIRLYVNGNVNPHIKIMFNTDYNEHDERRQRARRGRRTSSSPTSSTSGSAGSCRRAIAPISTARTTPITGRVYVDGVQDGYPFIYQGRDNGVDVLGSVRQGQGLGRRLRRSRRRRATTRCWAPAACRSTSGITEAGYYLNGTYYGDKNLLAIGAAGQVQGSDKTACNVDFLLERKLGMAGAFTVEAEWARYRQPRRLSAADADGGYTQLDGGYVLGALSVPEARRARASSSCSASTARPITRKA